MLIQISNYASESEIKDLFQLLDALNMQKTEIETQSHKFVVISNAIQIDIRRIGNHKAVKDIHVVNDPYKLVSSLWRTKYSHIECKDGVLIGDRAFQTILGPCSIEDENQVEQVSDFLVENGIALMRGGVFKPRSSPYSFRGLGIEGLKMWSSIVKPKGIGIVTEIMEPGQLEEMYPYVDVFQIGARNAQNYNLLEVLGEQDKPVILKRGMSMTVEEWLYSAEYIFSAGNERIILCERGIRTYENVYRNTLDLNVVPILKEKTHLPVIVDPSHGIGVRKYVPQMALAGTAAGADGLLVEIHPTPEVAKSDGQQTLNFKETKNLLNALKNFN